MKIEDHQNKLKESLKVIEESIEKGIGERQRTIGFSASVACVDMLEIHLHKHGLITPGFMIKHEWFNSKNKIAEKFPFDFPRKEEILTLVCQIENLRNPLCYGKPQKEEIVLEVIIVNSGNYSTFLSRIPVIDNSVLCDVINRIVYNAFNKLKQVFKEEGVHE